MITYVFVFLFVFVSHLLQYTQKVISKAGSIYCTNAYRFKYQITIQSGRHLVVYLFLGATYLGRLTGITRLKTTVVRRYCSGFSNFGNGDRKWIESYVQVILRDKQRSHLLLKCNVSKRFFVCFRVAVIGYYNLFYISRMLLLMMGRRRMARMIIEWIDFVRIFFPTKRKKGRSR